MANIPQGQSELDTVVLRLSDFGIEIKNWQKYSLTSAFPAPTDTWTFTISGEDTALYQKYLVPGSRVQMVINDKVQCTGFIDKRMIGGSRSGTTITITGRDVLARVVSGNADPLLKLKTDLTVGDLIGQTIAPYNIGELYNSYGTNLNIITGRPNSESLSTTVTKVPYGSKYKKDSYGKIIISNGKLVLDDNRPTKDVTEVTANIKPGLSKIKIKNCKPHPGEGAYAYVERLIRREGLIMKAMADGDGVYVVSPDFDGDLNYNIILKRTVPNQNNVLTFSSDISWEQQPSVIVVRGFGGGHEFTHGNLYVVMVNELTGLDDNHQPLPEVQTILDNYKHAKLVDLRPELFPSKPALSSDHAFCPIYMIDDEAKDLDQLEYFAKRKMAEHQMKGLMLKYSVAGHIDRTSPANLPWAVNTLVNVDDDINDIHEPMWVLERTFTKSRAEGTLTNLTLIRPYTYQIG